jgi:hypothetical protein
VTARSRVVLAAGALLVASVLIGGLIGGVGDRPHGTHQGHPTTQTGRSSTFRGAPKPIASSSPPDGWRPVAPATTVPADSPVQQQYDQGFEQGFSSAANRAQLAEIEALSLPAPAVTGGWPIIAPAYTPEGWTRQFVGGLLDIDFARQNRLGLGAWLVAEEALDLMPGIPAGAQLGTLYATVMDPAVTGQLSPIPPAAVWQADAAAGVRWSVSNLQVQLDPAWQSMITAGWQPVDLYASVEDVSGILTVTRHSSSAQKKSFSVQLQLGSGHWHPGYGTALVSSWQES